MNFLYPRYCNDPVYVQKELSDEEFFSSLKPEYGDIAEYVSEKDYSRAWEAYLALISETVRKRTFYRISDTDEIKEYINTNFSAGELTATLKPADDLTNYIFKLSDDEPFVFSENNIPWNETMGNSVYNQLFLTYMTYLGHLGTAYMITKDSKYARFFSKLINSFIDTCPVPKGGDFAKECSTWTRLGVALRLTGTLNNLALMFDDKSFDIEIKKRIIKHMFQTAQYVRKYNADNGNHVVVQMTGLVCASAFYAEFRESDDWLEYALLRLNKEIDESVYSDGVQAEGSPNYHLFVLNELTILKALQLNGYKSIPTEFEEKMHKMFVALRDMRTPEGHLLNLGDTSTGIDMSKKIKLAACLYKGEFAAKPDTKPNLSDILKFGADILNTDASAGANIPHLTVYGESGFLSYRSDFTPNADFMFMHAGEGINGHAHADSLSAILYANGRNILLDSGNAPYVWDKERKYTLSTSAHNTVKVDGEDSHVRMLHWLPMRTAPCKIWVCEETDDYVLLFASHYGYHRFDDPVVHTRKLIYIKDGGFFVVLDLLNAEERHSYEVFFHLPPSETCFDESSKSIYTKFDNANVMIYPANSCENSFEVINTAFHPNHNTKLTKPTYKILSENTGNKYFATLIVPFDKGIPQITVKTVPAYKDGCELTAFEATVLDVTVNNQRKTIAVNNLSIDPREYVNHEGNPDSDAHMKGKKNSVTISVNGKDFNDEVKIM